MEYTFKDALIEQRHLLQLELNKITDKWARGTAKRYTKKEQVKIDELRLKIRNLTKQINNLIQEMIDNGEV